MGLNKSTGNMYEFITHTINYLVGACPHGCSYCSTNKLKAKYPYMRELYSGIPRLNENQFKTQLGKGKFIFVCAQNDLFAETVPAEYIYKVVNHLKKYQGNKYLFQSKNPKRMVRILRKPVFYDDLKCVVCTTIETNRFYPSIMKNSPHPKDRADAFSGNNAKLFEKYVTIEPLMDFDFDLMIELIKMCNPVQVNIGANSYDKVVLPEPPFEKVLALIEELKKFTTISKKKNLSRLLKVQP